MGLVTQPLNYIRGDVVMLAIIPALGLEHGSSSRAQGPEFKHQYHPKLPKQQKNKILTVLQEHYNSPITPSTQEAKQEDPKL
jgi:hypothetical protein